MMTEAPLMASPAPKKRNRRTLRNRIRRTIYSSSFINIMIFTLIILFFFALIFRPAAGFGSGFIGHTIAEQMSSRAFVLEQGIEDLKDFNPDSQAGQMWVQQMNRTAELQTYLPSEFKVGVPHPGGEDRPSRSHNLRMPLAIDFVLLEVKLDDKTVYNNRDRLSEWFGMESNRLIDYYAVASSYPLVNKEGEEVGSVTAMIAPQLVFSILISVTAVFLLVVFITLFITHLISKLISRRVMQPLEQLNSRVKAIAQEDFETTMNTQIELVKPFREVEELADSTNLIMQKMKEYNERLHHQKNTVEEQNEELEAQNEELIESKRLLQEAQDRLIIRERAIRNLLDHAGQGFLTFGSDLLVDEEYSQECEHIFGAGIGQSSIARLIGRDDPEQIAFLESLLAKIFLEPDPYRREIYISLMAQEITVEGRHISIGYKMIPAGSGQGSAMMAILTDITDKRQMEIQMDAERNVLKMVVKVIVQYGDFIDCVRDYKSFVESELREFVSGSEEPKVLLLRLYRDLHTYKGNFSQFGLTHVTEHLHEAESVLTEAIKCIDDGGAIQLEELVGSFRFTEWLDQDFEVLRSVLGDSFFHQQDLLLIDKSKIVDIEKKMIALLAPNECKLLLPDLRKLRYKPFKELLKSYPDYVESLSERLEKYVHPFEVEGDDFLADNERYYDFSRSLIHVFRNIVDHAIEPADERLAAGKEEFGTIRCRITREGTHAMLSISDDGRGILPDTIRRKAASKGILTPEELERLDDPSVIALIFRDEFSTRDEVSELSGRGIGLSAVKVETERLGGSVEVRTEPGEGTEFRFILPYEDLSGMPETEFPAMLQPSLQVAKDYFERYVSVRLDGGDEYGSHPEEKLVLMEVTSFVSLKGAVEGMFILSMDRQLSRVLTRHMVLEPLTSEEEDRYLEDSLAEASNIILGNSFNMFGSLADYILMEPPITIRTEGASVKMAESQIWSCRMDSPQGGAKICFVLTKR
ncbi:ATP-binding protein [Gorillibacterium sp. sgz5001074]|uniref:ATP-binding protein n=1 Tax=Gorillibacterium sp. sgz5001074 TaxID=3446695 RepID=UPI003F6701CC